MKLKSISDHMLPRKRPPNASQNVSSQRQKGGFPKRSLAKMLEKVLVKSCLPVYSVSFALLKGKVNNNHSLLNVFRCFVTRGSYRKPASP